MASLLFGLDIWLLLVILVMIWCARGALPGHMPCCHGNRAPGRSPVCTCPRRGHDVLRCQLPSKQEHVVLVRLSPIQRALYTEFMNRFREAGNSGWLSLNPLKAFCVCCKVRLPGGPLGLFWWKMMEGDEMIGKEAEGTGGGGCLRFCRIHFQFFCVHLRAVLAKLPTKVRQYRRK